jgi:hypothetical protein
LATAAFAATTTTPAGPTPAATASIRRRLLKRLNLALHKIPIELAIRIIRPQLQCRLIRLYRISPLRNGLLRSGFLQLLPSTIQRVAQVVVGVLLIRQPLRVTSRSSVDRTLESLRGLWKLPGPVCSRTGVVVRQGRGRGVGLISAHRAWRNGKHPDGNQQCSRRPSALPRCRLRRRLNSRSALHTPSRSDHQARQQKKQ